VKASINGQARDLPDDLTVGELLAHLHAPDRGIAVAKNDKVVRRSRFADERVCEGDRIEIIRAVAGG
jgi:sulfur carrier protein